MSSITRTITVGDTWPPLSVDVRFEDEALDIRTFTDESSTVTFTLRHQLTHETPVNEAAGTIEDGDGRFVVCTYELQAGDTNVVGKYDVLVKLTVGGSEGTVRGMTLVIDD